MDRSFVKKYWKSIRKEAFSAALRFSRFLIAIEGLLIAGGIIFLITGLINSSSMTLPGNVPPINLINGSIISVLTAFVTFFFSYFFFLTKAHPQRIYDKEIEIARLNERLSIKEYDEIQLEFYEPPVSKTEKLDQLLYHRYQNPKQRHLFLLLKNTGAICIQDLAISCKDQIRIVHPNPEEYQERIEQIELNGFVIKYNNDKNLVFPGGNAIVHIAEMDVSQPYFYFSFQDGLSGVARMLVGRWYITLQVFGKAKKTETIEDLESIIFNLTFDFDYSGFSNIEVIKLPQQ